MVVRQRRENTEVRYNSGRLVKRSDEILARGRVNTGLAADGSIDHREQGRWDLDVWDASHECGGYEAREIANNASAQRDDGGVATEAALQQRVCKAAP